MCLAGQNKLPLDKFKLIFILVLNYLQHMTRKLSGSQCNLHLKDAWRVHESLKSMKADTFTTLVSRSCNTAAVVVSVKAVTCLRVREPQNMCWQLEQTCLACGTSNRAFVDVIIGRLQVRFH
jgi:hypothetical protein